jgi:arsenate reductase (thioredoxin)
MARSARSPREAGEFRIRRRGNSEVKSMKTFLFACVHNAGRSQMAAAWFNRLADGSRARGLSAGTQPAGRVHPEVITVMGEVGIDLTDAVPQKLTDDLALQAQVLITMGCGDECPYVPGARTEDWPIPDPKGQGLEVVRTIRDSVRVRVEELLAREGLVPQ